MDTRRRFMIPKKEIGPGGIDTTGAYTVDLKDN